MKKSYGNATNAENGMNMILRKIDIFIILHYNSAMEYNEQLILRISKELKDWLKAKARQWKTTPSEYVRMILSFHQELEQKGKGG